jgi:hypothetical protein
MHGSEKTVKTPRVLFIGPKVNSFWNRMNSVLREFLCYLNPPVNTPAYYTHNIFFFLVKKTKQMGHTVIHADFHLRKQSSNSKLIYPNKLVLCSWRARSIQYLSW